MKKILVVMIMLSLVMSVGCSNGNKKEEHTSLDVSEAVQSSVFEDSAVSKVSNEVSEKSVAESSPEEKSEISQVKEDVSESENISESEEECEDQSIAESLIESYKISLGMI